MGRDILFVVATIFKMNRVEWLTGRTRTVQHTDTRISSFSTKKTVRLKQKGWEGGKKKKCEF